VVGKRLLHVLTSSQHCASRRPVHRRPRGAYEFFRRINMPVGRWQFTEHRRCRNAVPLHVDVPRTYGGGSDLPSEAVIQEYLRFPYDYFLLVLQFGGYCCKLCTTNNPRRKKSHGLRSGERCGQIMLTVLSPKTSDKACIDMRAVWAVAESCWNW
jgi:hypothetical protein